MQYIKFLILAIRVRQRTDLYQTNFMKPSFHSYLANDPFQDPVLLVDFQFTRRALLFDAGDLRQVPSRILLRVTDLFISHRHMDHFADFDRLIRLNLGRGKCLRVYGPEGIIAGVAAKLSAYNWNLVSNYTEAIEIEVIEMISEQTVNRALFHCQNEFRLQPHQSQSIDDKMVLSDTSIQVRATILDHGLPCLGFSIQEPMHVNIWKNRLMEMDLEVGPWLTLLKQAVMMNAPDETPIQVQRSNDSTLIETMPLKVLKEKIVKIVPGQHIGYLVDVSFNDENLHRLLPLFHNADHLYIEAPFLHRDLDHAIRKRHLTAKQAGTIAKLASVKSFTLCHFSPRYAADASLLQQEAEEAFDSTKS
ncbi:MAG TPA: ribonuclease Z [Gammaproteobacteria bacterium]|nr:ribonuclease Z [Gammaproteobacteria bacterium]